MSFLKWLDKLNTGLDTIQKGKRAVDTILNAGHAHHSVTEPIRQALDYVKGLKNDGTAEAGGGDSNARTDPETTGEKR